MKPPRDPVDWFGLAIMFVLFLLAAVPAIVALVMVFTK